MSEDEKKVIEFLLILCNTVSSSVVYNFKQLGTETIHKFYQLVLSDFLWQNSFIPLDQNGSILLVSIRTVWYRNLYLKFSYS